MPAPGKAWAHAVLCAWAAWSPHSSAHPSAFPSEAGEPRVCWPLAVAGEEGRSQGSRGAASIRYGAATLCPAFHGRQASNRQSAVRGVAAARAAADRWLIEGSAWRHLPEGWGWAGTRTDRPENLARNRHQKCVLAGGGDGGGKSESRLTRSCSHMCTSQEAVGAAQGFSAAKRCGDTWF